MLTIVIPTKDEEKNLPALLRSIHGQTYQPKEVIVADAQSQDATRTIAKEFGARVVDGGSVGFGRNAGAKQVTTDTILFLDADVVLPEGDFLERAFTEFGTRGLDIATCDVIPQSQRKIDHWLHGFYNRFVRLCGSHLAHAPGFFIMVRTHAHRAIGGFDEEIVFCEDHSYARVLAKTHKFGFLNSVKLPVSVRRLNRDGRFTIAIKFILAELHLIFLGPIKHDRFNYTFGHKDD